MEQSERSDGAPVVRLILWTAAVFCAGYTAASFGPSAEQILARWGVVVRIDAADPAPERAPAPPSAADDVRALLAQVGGHVGRLDTRIAELESGLKENGISRSILAGRDSAGEQVFRRLDEERARLEDALAALEQDLAEALDLEARLQLVLDAASNAGGATSRGTHTLADARTLLERLDR